MHGIPPKSLFRAELTVVKLRIKSAASEKFLMGSAFKDGAVLHHNDAVRVTDSRKAMRDDERGSSLHEPCKRILHLHLRARIDGRGCLIENQHRRSEKHHPRYAEKLTLALGEIVVADHGIVSVLKPLYEAVCARRLCRRDYLIIARAFPAERNILFYRGVLYPCVLKNHPEILAQAFSRNVGDILAVDQYASLGRRRKIS